MQTAEMCDPADRINACRMQPLQSLEGTLLQLEHHMNCHLFHIVLHAIYVRNWVYTHAENSCIMAQAIINSFTSILSYHFFVSFSIN